MAIQNDNTVLCKGDLKAYHEKILPYLGGNFMLGTNVSDYYSTDEKIVGVWTDGKPLYQKTYYFSALGNGTTSSVAHTSIPTNITNLDIITKIEGVAYDKLNSMHFIPVPVTSGVNSNEWDVSCWAITQNGTHNLVISVARDMRSYSAYMTLQYTKTTDTASSALTTPGCYDLNRPDLWPANKEIFFGNGLYGYRATGNMPALAENQKGYVSNLLPNTTMMGGTSHIINIGGNIEVLNSGEYMVSAPVNCQYTTAGETNHGESSIYRTGDYRLTLCIIMIDWHCTASQKYDIWVTYTK